MALVSMSIESVRRGLEDNEEVLVLKEVMAERYLPIYMGRFQAELIKKQLIGKHPVRSGDLPVSLDDIDLGKYELESVIINRFEDSIFYTKLLFRHEDETQEVDCSLAEAIAYGANNDVPILADETVLKRAGIQISA